MAKKQFTDEQLSARAAERKAYRKEYYKKYYSNPDHPERREKRCAAALKHHSKPEYKAKIAAFCADKTSDAYQNQLKRNRDHYHKDPERARAVARKRNARCRAKKLAAGDNSNSEKAAAWQKAHPIRAKYTRFKTQCKHHGITFDKYIEMLEQQLGVCAICGQPETHTLHKNLSVDHAHAPDYAPNKPHTAESVRGLLCHNCNIAIGLMGDDYTRLLNAAEYLLSHRDKAPTPSI